MHSSIQFVYIILSKHAIFINFPHEYIYINMLQSKMKPNIVGNLHNHYLKNHYVSIFFFHHMHHITHGCFYLCKKTYCTVGVPAGMQWLKVRYYLKEDSNIQLLKKLLKANIIWKWMSTNSNTAIWKYSKEPNSLV